MKTASESSAEAEDHPKTQHTPILRLIGATLLWLIAWPLIVGAIAFVVLMLFAGVFAVITEGKAPPAFASRAYMLLFTLTMTIVCLLIIRKRKASDKWDAWIGTNVLKGYMCLGILLGAGIACVIPDTAANSADAGIQTNTTAAVAIPALVHDSSLVAILRQVGAMDIELIDERYVDGYSDPAFPEKWGEYQVYVNSATKQFAYGTLTVKRGLEPDQEKVAVAHEYLHHVWFKLLDDQTKENLTAHLIGMYGNDPAIRTRVRSYVNAGRLYPTELFSYYCTESSDGYLTRFVLDTCNKYINRSALRLAR